MNEVYSIWYLVCGVYEVRGTKYKVGRMWYLEDGKLEAGGGKFKVESLKPVDCR
ncbi:hypothetical protein [Algoriphagus machipongonensis]|uniref:hypothetical protein n=1 Tax=Algoriphagus machipongonensis TaxID=388413 RepID=UPI00129406D1|nr:hypothetical protein [Algoriphagus machipongonensis]